MWNRSSKKASCFIEIIEFIEFQLVRHLACKIEKTAYTDIVRIIKCKSLYRLVVRQLDYKPEVGILVSSNSAWWKILLLDIFLFFLAVIPMNALVHPRPYPCMHINPYTQTLRFIYTVHVNMLNKHFILKVNVSSLIEMEASRLLWQVEPLE